MVKSRSLIPKTTSTLANVWNEFRNGKLLRIEIEFNRLVTIIIVDMIKSYNRCSSEEENYMYPVYSIVEYRTSTPSFFTCFRSNLAISWSRTKGNTENFEKMKRLYILWVDSHYGWKQCPGKEYINTDGSSLAG